MEVKDRKVRIKQGSVKENRDKDPKGRTKATSTKPNEKRRNNNSQDEIITRETNVYGQAIDGGRKDIHIVSNRKYKGRKKNVPYYQKSVNEKKVNITKKEYVNNLNNLAEEEESNSKKDDNDLIYRTLYKTGLNAKKGNDNKESKYSTEQRTIEDNKQERDNNKKLGITKEKTDDIKYNKNNKKLEERERENEYKNNKIRTIKNYDNIKWEEERAMEFYVIDTDEDKEIKISTKYRKKIDLRRNKLKEICIEKKKINDEKEEMKK